MRKVKSTKSTQLMSWRALAEALGIDHGQLYRTAHGKHDERWPVALTGPWKQKDVQRVAAWLERVKTRLAAKIKDDAEPGSINNLRKDKLREEIEAMKLRNLAAATELAKVRGELIPASEVAAEWERIGLRLRTSFANLGSSILPVALARGMPMQAAAEFQSIVQQQVDAVLRVAASDGQQEADDAGTGNSDPAQPEEARP